MHFPSLLRRRMRILMPEWIWLSVWSVVGVVALLITAPTILRAKGYGPPRPWEAPRSEEEQRD